MSSSNGNEKRDIFGDEDHGFCHFLPFQDSEQALKSVKFSDSHKKLRYDAINDVNTNIDSEGASNVPSLPRKDGRVLSSALKVGSSNILDLSWSLPSEKTAQALGLTKCSTGNTILACEGVKISTSSFGEGENSTGNTPLCSDYRFQGDRGVVHKKKLGDISSTNAFVSGLTKEQRDGEDDLQFYDCPINGDCEGIDTMLRNLGSTFAHGSSVTEDEISWFSSSSHGFLGMKDTLQSVVLSSVSESSAFNNSSSSHGFCVNTLSAIEPSTINTETPSGTFCSSVPFYPDTERKDKSVLSELVHVHAGVVEKSLAYEHIGYGNECRDPNMINMTLKDLYTTTGKEVNSTLGLTVQKSLHGCPLTKNVQDQELLSSVLSDPQPYSLQAISKQNCFSESYASNYKHSYNPQAEMSDIFNLLPVPPGQTTLNSSVNESIALPDYVTSNNPLRHAPQSIGILPGPFSMRSMPIEKDEKIYARQKFSAALVMNKPLVQHAATGESSVQRKYKFEDEVERDKNPVYTSGNLQLIDIGSKTFQGDSCMTGTLIDDVSLKSANFQQLQIITHRLGIRTKLCIRDSLYRLARSAEQSHYYGTANNVSNGSSPVMELHGSKDSKRAPEILGVSISTNAIERSVAYLLFHKSFASATGTADDSMWFKSPIHIRGSVGNSKEPDPPAL